MGNGNGRPQAREKRLESDAWGMTESVPWGAESGECEGGKEGKKNEGCAGVESIIERGRRTVSRKSRAVRG
jgi:hypothetical protein